MTYQVMPPLSADEYQELKADIAKRGVLVAVELDDAGNILDGHHRVQAAQELGLQDWPQIVRIGLTEDEKRTHARKLNMARRHLSREQRREMIEATARENPNKSNRQIANDLGVSEHTVASVRGDNPELRRAQNADVATVTDTLGRVQPARKAPSWQPSDIAQQTGEQSGDALSNENAPAYDPPDWVVKQGAETEAPTKPDIKPYRWVDPSEVGQQAAIDAGKQARKQRSELLRQQNEEVSQREVQLPDGKFNVIIIDPPWPMQKIERDLRPNQVAFEYPTMSEPELYAFSDTVQAMAADDCHIFMWTTQKFLPLSLALMEPWGFRYVLTMVWHKPGGFQPIGLPQYNCEFAIYGRRGSPKFVDTKAFNCCFSAPRHEHSRKPDEFYDLVRRVTDGRRIDVFSRERRDGFDQFGNETEKFQSAGEL